MTRQFRCEKWGKNGNILGKILHCVVCTKVTKMLKNIIGQMDKKYHLPKERDWICILSHSSLSLPLLKVKG